MRVIIVALVAFTSCVPFRGRSLACSADAPADAAPVVTDQVPTLAGRYRLVLVAASNRGSAPPVATSHELILTTPDSATVAQSKRRGIGYFTRGDLKLVGVLDPGAGRQRDTAEWEGRTLYLGCRGCLDASPTHLLASWMSPDGFWGHWEDFQTGIAVVVDSSGKRTANPSGYFCATRQ